MESKQSEEGTWTGVGMVEASGNINIYHTDKGNVWIADKIGYLESYDRISNVKIATGCGFDGGIGYG